jgi:hypothetical protein
MLSLHPEEVCMNRRNPKIFLVSALTPTILEIAAFGAGSIDLAETGQARCYSYPSSEIPCAGTGQDGETQTGVVWPYPRFTDNNNGTVTDNLTGRIWTKNAKTPGPAICTPETSKTWQVALDYIKCPKIHSYLGYNDWRLPNRKEIRSLINYSRNSPALPVGHPFTNVIMGFWDFYWSSTTDPQQASTAWIIYMSNGSMTNGEKTSHYARWVWPVRAGVPPDLIIDEVGTPLTSCGGQAIEVTDMVRNIIAHVDAYDSVREFDEGNNVKSRYVTIERCR